jgi:carboxyl-terminal processing protease
MAAVLALSFVSLAAGPGGGEVATVQPAAPHGPVQGDLTPESYERELARVVADMLADHHYDKKSIDDTTSQRWLDHYIEFLDHGRNVFLQSDVDEFEAKYATRLDDLMQTRFPDLEPAIAIYQRYRERLTERVRHASAVLEAPVDLTNPESYVPDRHELPWPATAAEANDLWRQRVEEDFIEGLLDGRDTEADLRTKLKKRYERSTRNADERDSVDVLELWLAALTRTYDPHSTWLKPASSADFNIDITNSVEGSARSSRPRTSSSWSRSSSRAGRPRRTGSSARRTASSRSRRGTASRSTWST